MKVNRQLLAVALVCAGCASSTSSAPTLDRYAGGTDAERTNALKLCQEQSNEVIKSRTAVGYRDVARMDRAMTDITDRCMRARGFQLK